MIKVLIHLMNPLKYKHLYLRIQVRIYVHTFVYMYMRTYVRMHVFIYHIGTGHGTDKGAVSANLQGI